MIRANDWRYIAPRAAFDTFGDPLATGKNTFLDLRAIERDGGAHQTLSPPGAPDGERRELDGKIIPPAVISACALPRRYCPVSRGKSDPCWLAISTT